MAGHEKTLQQLKSEIEAIEAEEAGVQGGMVDLRHELERHNLKLKDCQQKVKHYQNEVWEAMVHTVGDVFFVDEETGCRKGGCAHS